MAIRKRFVLLGVGCWLISACNLVSLPPTAAGTASHTDTPQPTWTAPPTNIATAVSTLTLAPPTPGVPPPAVLTEYLENVRVVQIDTFDDASGWEAGAQISNGELLLAGTGDDWHGVSRKAVFQEGEGVVTRFRFSGREFFELYFEKGSWDTRGYKRFGIYVHRGYGEANLFIGQEGRGSNRLPGNLSLSPETWYSLFMAVGKDGDFLAVLWDPSSPDKSIRYREKIQAWAHINWQFRIQVNEGTIFFDDFQEIEFDGIR